MSGDYAILSSIYDHTGMSSFAKEMTPRVLQYAQQNEWLGRRILDLGCGTGASVLWFAQHGYNVIGVDNSPEMIAVAQTALQTKSLSSRIINMDIRALEIHDAIDMVVAFDVLNDLDSIRELEAVFKSIHDLLTPERWFIFDLHTIEGVTRSGISSDYILHEDESLVVFVRPDYDFERQIYTVSYDFFQTADQQTWQRHDAQRILRAYPITAVATLLRRQGLEILTVMDTRMTTYEPGVSNAPRVVFFVKRT